MFCKYLKVFKGFRKISKDFAILKFFILIFILHAFFIFYFFLGEYKLQRIQNENRRKRGKKQDEKRDEQTKKQQETHQKLRRTTTEGLYKPIKTMKNYRKKTKNHQRTYRSNRRRDKEPT